MTSSTPFQDITLKYRDTEYVIAANRVMAAISILESVVTIQELSAMIRTGHIPLARVCRAYALLLNYAGAKTDEQTLYGEMFNRQDKMELAFNAVTSLMTMMVPPSSVLDKLPKTPEDKKAGNARSRPSKRRTRTQ